MWQIDIVKKPLKLWSNYYKKKKKTTLIQSNSPSDSIIQQKYDLSSAYVPTSISDRDIGWIYAIQKLTSYPGITANAAKETLGDHMPMQCVDCIKRILLIPILSMDLPNH
jgi:hypothetical protein